MDKRKFKIWTVLNDDDIVLLITCGLETKKYPANNKDILIAQKKLNDIDENGS